MKYLSVSKIILKSFYISLHVGLGTCVRIAKQWSVKGANEVRDFVRIKPRERFISFISKQNNINLRA